MAAPVLLVHDDIATIASVRRLLARDGYEVILATSAADAIIAFGHYLPGLVILAPPVEGGRGQVVLEELAIHPDRQLCRVMLLGESVPGFAAPVVPLPLDGTLFLETLQQVMRDPGDEADAWTMIEHPAPATPDDAPAPSAPEPEEWRATPPRPSAGLEESSLFGDLPKLNEEDWELATLDAPTRAELADAAAQRAIEAAHRELEEEALATLESSLAQELAPADPAAGEWARPPATEDLDAQLEDFEREVLDAARPSPEAELMRLEELRREAEDAARAEEERRLAAERAAEEERLAEEARARAEEENQRTAEALRAESERDAEEARRLAQALEADYRARLEEEHRLRAELQAQLAAAEARAVAEAQERRDVESRLATAEHALAERGQALQDAIAREQQLVERERVAAEHAVEAQRAAQEVKDLTLDRARQLQAQSDAAVAQLRAEVEKSGELARLEREEREALAANLAELHREREAAEARAEVAVRAAQAERLQLEEEQRARQAAEADAASAREAAEQLTALANQTLEVPAAAPLRLPPTGTATTEQLARLIAHLAEARAEVRIDLRVPDAIRTLWLQRGQFVGALSSLPHESLLDRARRDGLIDGRQDTELRLLRGMSPSELLVRLRQRGYLRDQEVVPLVHRYTEFVTLEALSEPTSEYRLSDDPLPPGVPVVELPRPPIALVLEALKRTLDGAAQLAELGGLAAIPVMRGDLAVDDLAAGLSERERRLLSHVDGETTVEELLLAAGLRQDAALKLLASGRALGWVDVLPAEVEAEVAPAPELELSRLDAKFREVQDADYFTILGLPRTAGEEEVQRAFAQLSSEFDPLRFIGHPDAAVQHQARQIQEALTEAAQVLGDDRLRAGYARNLVD